MKLGVFYPWDSPFMFTAFTENVFNLERPKDIETRFFRGCGWCSARRHADGYEKALAWGADLILCIGSDQAYPEDLLPRLLARHEETNGGVITALVPFRGFVQGQNMRPFQPVAWRIANNGTRTFRGFPADADMLKQIDPKEGDLQQVNIIGSGVLLLHKDQLQAIKRPWFYDRVNSETLERVADMDARFIWRLQTEAHAQVWVDTTIQVKHLDVFKIDDSFQYRFDDWSKEAANEH